MRISAIIVTYNRLQLLKMCIHHLLNQKYPLSNIIIINNNSKDGTESYLNSINNSNIFSINTHENLGGAGGFSLGTKIAYEKTDSQFFWLMDDDTIVNDASLDNLMTKARILNYNFGFLCSNVRWWKNKEVAFTNIPTPSKDWNEPLVNNLVKVNSTSFVSVLFSRQSVKKLGLPISDMFIWGDDVEFTTRLSRNNSRSYLVTNSLVFHKSNQNVSYNIVNSPRILYYKFGIRNRIFIERKYADIPHIVEKLFVYVFTILEILFRSKNKKFKRISYVLIGIIKGFFFNPKIKFPENINRR